MCAILCASVRLAQEKYELMVLSIPTNRLTLPMARDEMRASSKMLCEPTDAEPASVLKMIQGIEIQLFL